MKLLNTMKKTLRMGGSKDPAPSGEGRSPSADSVRGTAGAPLASPVSGSPTTSGKGGKSGKGRGGGGGGGAAAGGAASGGAGAGAASAATPATSSSGPTAAIPPSSSPGGNDARPVWPPCHCGCGWTAFPGHSTCCRPCSGPTGPHSQDCSTKNRRAQPPCELGCGRPAFASFATCCTRCTGSAGEHSADCSRKAGHIMEGKPPAPSGRIPTDPGRPPVRSIRPAIGGGDPFPKPKSRYGVESAIVLEVPTASTTSDEWKAPSAPPPGALRSVVVDDLLDLEEGLRSALASWQEYATSSSSSTADMDDTVGELASAAQVAPDVVKMMWHSVARSVRVAAPGSLQDYARLAKAHYGLDAAVIDLGQYSASNSNSCMFLSCAASIVYRALSSPGEALPALLKSAIDDEASFRAATIEDLIATHTKNRMDLIGRLADLLRHAACEELKTQEDLYFPFYAPVGIVSRHQEPGPEQYREWVAALAGSEEGDELVMLALAKICGCGVQAIQMSGYRVPLMDPLGVAEGGGFVAYWGNDDKHWVWLRPVDSPTEN